ncbi:MAG: TIM barrel protein, partial [Geobacter sp.]
MPSLLCAHVPWPRLAEHRDYLLGQRINPELYLPADALDTLDGGLVRGFAADLVDHGLSCTIHATFMDLNPGSVDQAVRAITRQRVEQTLAVAEILRPKVLVFHPGYSRLTYGSAVESWVANSVAFWQAQLPRVRQIGCTIALENIFEEEPSTLLQVLERINDPLVG